MAKRVAFNEDFFAQMAREHHDKWGTPPGDAHDDLAKELRDYDSRLTLRYHTEVRSFWVCYELPGYDNLHFPILDAGANPTTREVMDELHKNDLRGRGREAAAERLVNMKAHRDRVAHEVGEAAMPEIGPISRFLGKYDNDLSRRQAAEDIGKALRRAFVPTPTVGAGG